MERRGNGDGTVKKRTDGYYAVSLSDGKDADGKRIRHQATCKTRKEAIAKLDEWKAAKRNGIDLKNDDMTMSVLIDKWLDNCRPRIKATTMFSYEQLVRLHLRPALGDLKVVKVNAMTLDAFFTKKRAAGLGPSTLGYLRRLLHAIFEQAMDYDIVPRNVVKRTAAVEKSKFEAGFMTREQAQALVSILPRDAYGLFVLTCVTLGMRPAEVRGIRWSDIEFSDGSTVAVIHVCQQIKDARGVGGGYIVMAPKTRSGDRVIPLPRGLAERFSEHRIQRAANLAEVRAAGLETLVPNEWADLVFQGDAGRPLAERYTRRKFKEFLSAAGLDDGLRLYDCRHTFNAILGANGAIPEVRKDLMGHSSTQLVKDVYGHAMPSDRIAAMNNLGEILMPRQ